MSVTLVKDLGTQFISERSKSRVRVALYSCDRCGSHFKASVGNVKSGKTQSCGCLRLERLRAKITKHGLTDHKLYETWKSMKNRCYRKGNKYYDRYGGRGISVCDEWKDDFQKFFDWCVANGYSENLTIDRIDNDGPYSPDNCRFSTSSDQAINRARMANNSSGYTGVSFSKRHNLWVANISHNKKRKQIGYFKSAAEAASARKDYILRHNLPHRTD